MSESQEGMPDVGKEAEKRLESYEKYKRTIGVLYSLINERFRRQFPFVAYSSSALQLYQLQDGEKKPVESFSPSPDIDGYSSREGVKALEEFLNEEEVSGELGVSNLCVYSGDEVFPDPGISEPPLNLRCNIGFSGQIYELDVWSGIGEGVINSEGDHSKGNLIEGVTYPASVVDLPVSFTNLKGEEDVVGVPVFIPEAVGRIYNFIRQKEELMVDKGVKAAGEVKDRKSKVKAAYILRKVNLE